MLRVGFVVGHFVAVDNAVATVLWEISKSKRLEAKQRQAGAGFKPATSRFQFSTAIHSYYMMDRPNRQLQCSSVESIIIFVSLLPGSDVSA